MKVAHGAVLGAADRAAKLALADSARAQGRLVSGGNYNLNQLAVFTVVYTELAQAMALRNNRVESNLALSEQCAGATVSNTRHIANVIHNMHI